MRYSHLKLKQAPVSTRLILHTKQMTKAGRRGVQLFPNRADQLMPNFYKPQSTVADDSWQLPAFYVNTPYY